MGHQRVSEEHSCRTTQRAAAETPHVPHVLGVRAGGVIAIRRPRAAGRAITSVAASTVRCVACTLVTGADTCGSDRLRRHFLDGSSGRHGDTTGECSIRCGKLHRKDTGESRWAAGEDCATDASRRARKQPSKNGAATNRCHRIIISHCIIKHDNYLLVSINQRSAAARCCWRQRTARTCGAAACRPQLVVSQGCGGRWPSQVESTHRPGENTCQIPSCLGVQLIWQSAHIGRTGVDDFAFSRHSVARMRGRGCCLLHEHTCSARSLWHVRGERTRARPSTSLS